MATKNVYEMVTEKMLEAIESGVAPWAKPWNATNTFSINGQEIRFPLNAVSKKEYRGINIGLLTWDMVCKGYTDPRYLTYKQAQTLGGSVRKGEKGTMVVFWKVVDRVAAKPEEVEESEEETQVKTKKVLILRYYTVFNVEQCEGLKLPELTVEPTKPFDKIAKAEGILNSRSYAVPSLGHGGAQAFYSPGMDHVQMPKPETFVNPEAYYATRFHEEVHATGHSTRLNRSGIVNFNGFGTENYSREELVAEMGAAFLCAEAGIDGTLDRSAAYLKGWAKYLKEDTKAIVIAAAQAQKAAEYILAQEADEEEGE